MTSIGRRLIVLDLEGMTHHLEVEVTWEQYKTPWRYGPALVKDERRALGDNGLDAANIFMKIAWDSDHPGC